MESDINLWEELVIKKIQIAYAVILFIAVSWELFISIVSLKFIKRHQFKMKVFTLFILAINFSLLFRIAFVWIQLYNNRPYKWEQSDKCLSGFVSYSTSMLLSVAGVLNIYNWVSITISLHIYEVNSSEHQVKHHKILKVVILILIIILFGVHLAGYLQMWFSESRDMIVIGTLLIGYWTFISFFIISIAFVFIGHQLK